jgi:anti-anti-sigma regulatory factor
MTPGSQGIFVACAHPAVFVRVIGRGACRNSEALRNYGLQKLHDGCREMYIDLRACEAMDSTFLGVFAGLGIALRGAGSLNLLNLAGESRKAFHCLGLDQIASLVAPGQNCPGCEFPPDAEFEKLPGSDLRQAARTFDALENALLMLECHEDLCRLDERNEETFRDVKRFLREDIARHRGGPGPGR